MIIRINYKIKIVVFVSLITLIFGIYFYKNYNSTENKSRRAAYSEILSWFYSSKSIEHQNPDILRNIQSKNKFISLRKIVDNLDNDWEFEYENLDIHEVSYTNYIIDYTYFFKDAKTNQLKIFEKKYYYDLDLTLPIPLKSNTTLKSGNNYKILEEKSLWDGDYDTYCKKIDYNEN